MLNASIIIATYNRSASLLETLDSLLKQEMAEGSTYELIVADNNSSDNTKNAVHSYMSKFAGKLIYIFEPRQGKAYALNHAIANAKGEVIIFTDDDVILDPLWLKNLLDCFNKFNCDAIGGRILPHFTDQTPLWVRKNADLLKGPLGFYDFGTETKLFEKPMYEFFGANFGFKRRVFDDCGLFRTDVGIGKSIQGEDTEFVKRVQKSGKVLYYCGSALIHHKILKKITLLYIAQWNMALGRYRVIVDDQGKIDPSHVYYFGIPRYLIGQMICNTFQSVLYMANKAKFLEEWIALSQNWGKTFEIRSIYKKTKVKIAN